MRSNATTIVRLARRLVKRNNFADRITIIRGDIEKVNLPEKVDVIVSEWLGVFGVDENLLAPLLLARDRWLKPGGAMLPARVTAWIAPVWNEHLSLASALRTGRPYELDLSLVGDPDAESVMGWWLPADPDTLATDPQAMWTTDVQTMRVEDARQPLAVSLALTAPRTARVNALMTWFTAEFGGEITLTNAPTARSTHWGQYLFPLDRQLDLSEGATLRVEFACLPAGPGQSAFTWAVRLGDDPWERHDSRFAHGG